MTMQHNINILRRNIGRNMDESELQSIPRKIDNQRPVFVPIAIPAHDRQRRTDSFEIERDRRLTNIAQVPNLIRVARKIDNLLRQFAMSIGYDQDAHCIYFRTTDGADNADITSALRKIIRLNPRNPRLALHHVI